MSKQNRNDPCLCGSGKKYKKCCIDKIESIQPTASAQQMPQVPNYDSFIKKYNSVEILKILAVLQLHPENHGKNIRLESLVVSAINQNNTSAGQVNYEELKEDILKYCVRHVHEDPVEDFFTENILFVNGNNTVYPGIFVHAQEIVQSQLNTLTRMDHLPFSVRKEIYEGVLFMLHIHNHIAKGLKHSRRIFIETEEDELYLPSVDEIKANQKFFTYSREDISSICKELHLSEGVIDQFVYKHLGQKISLKNVDDNPLFQKPFMFLDGEFLLVMPTAQLGCINDFILEKIKLSHQLISFTQKHSDLAIKDVDTRLRSMGWERGNYSFPDHESFDKAVFRELFYQFDADKVAYVMMATPVPSGKRKLMADVENLNKKITLRAEKIAKEIKAQDPEIKLLFLFLFNKCDIFEIGKLNFNKIKTPDYHLIWTIKELNVLRVVWEFDELTLWKYAKHINDTRNEITFMPQNTELSIFKWYKDNHECYFHSDREPTNFAFFEFEIEGGVNRSAKLKEDLIGIPFPAERGDIYVSCRKKEEYLPVYLSDEFSRGYFRYCLLKYSCPIWVQSDTIRDFTASVYINGILYWLNHCHSFLDRFVGQLGEQPIVVTLMMDKALYDPAVWELAGQGESFKFSHRIVSDKRGIELTIPVEIISHLTNSGNGGEKFLISGLIGLIGGLIESLGVGTKLSTEELDAILTECMPLGMQKMILITDSSLYPAIAEVDTIKPKYIPSADISYVLREQVSWLRYSETIPKKIKTAKEKVTLLNDLVKVHFDQIVKMISNFPSTELLKYLMYRHESLIQSRHIGKLSYPALEACFGSFYDVFQEFSKKESEVVAASLSMRNLIEFVACERPKGNKIVNDGDIDLMLAHMTELINYGALSDMIKFGINDPDMGLLPSGRLGIDQTFNDSSMMAFRNDIHKEEFDDFKTSFERFFKEEEKKPKAKRGDDPYYDRVDDIFMKEWGITIWNLLGSCKFLCLQLFEKQKSVELLSEEDFIELFNRVDQSESETRAVLKLLTFADRDGIMNVDTKEIHEVFPWRYNRRISYMLKPLVKVVEDGRVYYLVSARHVFTAAENILARFLDGTLKVAKDQLKITNLLAERNHLKGKHFRDFVCKWLAENTKFEVKDFEVKIKPKGFFTSDVDKGDVDILCIDHENRIIYAIECKNTSQAKIAYDIYSEISNYIGLDGKPGMIDKHVLRDTWLKQNRNIVEQKLKLSTVYQIKSFVLTKYILPTRYIKDTAIPVYSVFDLTGGKIFK